MIGETLRFGRTTVELHFWGTVVRLPSGASVPGMPQDTEEYRARARAMGYGDDTLAMSRDHEAAHAALAHLIGLPCSPVLSTVAGVPVGDIVRHQLEEDAVLALQRWARAVGVDLVEAWLARQSGKVLR
jgi:hypothetical protein